MLEKSGNYLDGIVYNNLMKVSNDMDTAMDTAIIIITISMSKCQIRSV